MTSTTTTSRDATTRPDPTPSECNESHLGSRTNTPPSPRTPHRQPGSPPLRGLGTSSFAQGLFREWDRLERDRSLDGRVRAWNLPGAPDTVSAALVACGYGGDRTDDATDATLAELVRIAAGDDLAARIVLQRILPGVVSIARRRSRMFGGGLDGVLHELVGCVWLLTRTFPVERRPRRIAANLLRDAEYEAFHRPRRKVATQREIATGGLDDLSRSPDAVRGAVDPVGRWLEDPRRELSELLGIARRGGLGDDDVDLLDALGSGRSVTEIATGLGISDRAVRARRSGAVERLRQVTQNRRSDAA